MHGIVEIRNWFSTHVEYVAIFWQLPNRLQNKSPQAWGTGGIILKH